MSLLELQRSLSAKIYRAQFGISDDGFVFSGQTIPADIDAQLQIFAAYLFNPGFNPDGLQRFKSISAGQFKQAQAAPISALLIALASILHNGDRRWEVPSDSMVAGTNPADIESFFAPVLATGAIDVTIVGDISNDKAIKAVAQTLGALPARNLRADLVARDDAQFLAAPGAPIAIATSGAAAQDIACAVWPTHGLFPDVRDDVVLRLMSAIMQERLMHQLRDAGTVYVAQVQPFYSRVFDFGYLQALSNMPPGQAGAFFGAVDAIVAELKAGHIAPDELERARNPVLTDLAQAKQSNEFWLQALDGAQEDQSKLAFARISQDTIRQVTLKDVIQAAGKYLDEARMVKLVAGGKPPAQ